MTRTARDGAARAATAADRDSVARCDSLRQVAADAGNDSLPMISRSIHAMDREPRAARSRVAASLDRKVSGSLRATAVLLRLQCAGISDTSTLVAGRPKPRRRTLGSRTRAAAELVARALDNALLPRLLIEVLFQIAELRVCSSSDLTKWGSPRMMHSLVMLTATRNQPSALHAAACTGRAWSGSDQMCDALRTYEEDSTRKQSIPHPRGAPDS